MSDKIKSVGSRAQVLHGTARATSGGLTKKDLFMKKGRIVSRKASAAGKKALKFLTRQGYIAKKGTFTLMRKSMARSPKSHKARKSSKRSKRARHTKKRGGYWFEEAKQASPSLPSASAPMGSAMGSAMGSMPEQAAGFKNSAKR